VVIRRIFHAWEQRLATIDTNRIVRPFEWGLDWLGLDPAASDPAGRLAAWAREAVEHSERFYEAPASDAYERQGEELRFPSALVTPFPENNLVRVRVFPPRDRRLDQPRRAVIVIPQWNADENGHVGLCRLFARFGLTAVRISLPYHDARRPAELQRADYIVSSNLGRTLHANQQAVLDIKRTVDWLAREGFERVGIIGTSLGSCLSMLAMAHDPRIRAGAFNHISPYFADVVWRGLSTRHVRDGLQGHISLDQLRDCWMPISPWPFISRVKGRRVLLIYARYDLTFPVDLSRNFVAEFVRRQVPHELGVLPCGHYTTGKAPFSYLDGFYLTKFFVKNL
jgi:pimeloyl-ACP methyl ester carboxylesterase